jgi:hypothetical protein
MNKDVVRPDSGSKHVTSVFQELSNFILPLWHPLNFNLQDLISNMRQSIYIWTMNNV